MKEKNISVKLDGSIAIVTINRPEKRNAIDYETQLELINQTEILSKDNEVKVIILTGAGENIFASGADIGKLLDRKPLESLETSMQHLTNHIANIPKPVIAAINGHALGGGCEISLACDIRIAANSAKIGFPELNLGIIPGGGGTQRLTELVGTGKAKELIYTGDILSASDAEKIGLINKVIESEKLIDSAKDMANKISKKAPVAIKFAKQAINAPNNAAMHAGLQIEQLSQALLMSTEDKHEGTTAFLEKRKAIFKGQ